MDSNPFAVLSLIVAPAILTNASSVLIMSTSNRLAAERIGARELSKQLEGTTDLSCPDAQRRLKELTASEDRTLLLLRSLRSFYVALGAFALAAFVSLLGAVTASIRAGCDRASAGTCRCRCRPGCCRRAGHMVRCCCCGRRELPSRSSANEPRQCASDSEPRRISGICKLCGACRHVD